MSVILQICIHNVFKILDSEIFFHVMKTVTNYLDYFNKKDLIVKVNGKITFTN